MTFLILAIIGIALTAVFNSYEMSYLLVNKTFFQDKFKKGMRDFFSNNPHEVIITVLIGTNIGIVASTIFFKKAVLQFHLLPASRANIVTGFAMTFLLFIFAELIPKTLSLLIYRKIVRALSSFIYLSYSFFLPVIKSFAGIFKNSFAGEYSRANYKSTEEAISFLVELKKTFPDIDEELSYIKQTVKILNNPVKKHMIPLRKVAFVNIAARADLNKLFLSDYALAYHKNIDNISGIIESKYLTILLKDKNVNIAKYISIPIFLPEYSTVVSVVERLSESTSKFAVIVDEYGNIKGLFTMKNIIECF